jgi:hypothetical protein
LRCHCENEPAKTLHERQIILFSRRKDNLFFNSCQVKKIGSKKIFQQKSMLNRLRLVIDGSGDYN